MTREEKILLLDLILRDIRGNWGWDLEKRLARAKELSVELGLKAHEERVDSFEKQMRIWGMYDGRDFRCSYKDGGYEDMEILHGLQSTIGDKSTEFQIECVDILTYPDCRFDDWDDYIDGMDD